MVLSNTPLPTVFEISDIHIPEEINKLYLESLDFNYHFSNLSSLREVCYISEHEENFYKSMVNELGEKFKSKLLELKDSDFAHWWPVDMYECLNLDYTSEIVGAHLLKDSPKFNMGPHVDNGLSIGTSIINIIDQDSQTLYYKDISMNEVLYSGPSSRGTGVIHLNHPGLWHSGVSNDSSHRYILKVYYGINHLI